MIFVFLAVTLILMINCTVSCFGQCLQRDTQQATCKNLDNELLKEQLNIAELKMCLQSEVWFWIAEHIPE